MTDYSRNLAAKKRNQPKPFPNCDLQPQFATPGLQPRGIEHTAMRNPASAEAEDAKRMAEKLAVENESLRQSFNIAASERDDMQDAVDKILADLMETQQELEEIKEAKAESDAELMHTKQATRRQLEERENTLESLTAKVAAFQVETKQGQSQSSLVGKENNNMDTDSDAWKLKRIQSELEVTHAALASNDKIISQLQTTERECRDIQLKVERLEGLLRSKDSTIVQLENINDKAKQVTKDLGMELDSRSQVLSQLNTEVQQLRSSSALEISELRAELDLGNKIHSETRRVKDSQAIELSQLRSQLESRNQVHVNPEADQLIASQTAELEQMRPMYSFFKKSSERLSKESKDMTSKIRALEDSLVSRDRQIAEQAQHIASLLAQVRERQPRPY
jgi:chromosome segregation ATPase